MKRTTPEAPNFAQDTGDGRLFAPSAARNFEPIAQELTQIIPTSGQALELASGTGQHIAQHAANHPKIEWHPSEIDTDRRASIDAYVAQAGLGNLHAARALNATQTGWGTGLGFDLILLSNLLHLISDQEAKTLIAETALALAPQGRFFLYGPFMRNGELTSEGDESFHNSLQAQDPAIGYKDDQTILSWAEDAGLTVYRKTDMPANNLAFTFEKP